MSAGEKVNILLVDDQPGKLMTYEVMLRELGENLLVASSANEALQSLLRHDVAVILIDVCMPDLDGFALAAMIREHPRFQKTAIIFISAIQVAESDYLRGYDAGAVDYVPVPVVPQLLRAKVRVFADLYRKTKQLERLNAELEQRVAERTEAVESAAARLMQSEQGRTLALAAGNMGAWEWHAADDSWTWDEGHARIFGVAQPVGTRVKDARVSRFFPEEDWRTLETARVAVTPQKSTFHIELFIRRRSGELRSCLIAGAATFGPDGKIARVDGVTIDITDRKQAETMQVLLAREVDHRARNALAVVQAIIRLARADSQEAYVAAVDGRVRALAHTHDLLSKSRWQGADVRTLVMDEMAPYAQSGRISTSGPSTILPAEKAQTVGLALHELATNAAKYGALSCADGRVAVGWSIDGSTLHFTWEESGGPHVEPPARSGFGTKIIQASLNEQKGDSVRFEWDPLGLKCTIQVQCGDAVAKLQRAPGTEISANDIVSLRSRALVVEDEALVGMFTCDCLEELGYAIVGPFATMLEAEDAAEREDFDCAVLDVNLVGRPVYPLAERLSAMNIPFVFVTGYGRESINPKFSRAPVLQKPFAKEALAAAMERARAPADEDVPASKKTA
jgi:two-component sensor histidine kinase/DNA-binding response OmpR family regulator